MAETRYPIWANTFIPDIGNGDPNIVDPGAPKQESGFIVEKPLVQEMNWILQQLGRYVTANNAVFNVPDTYQLVPGDIVRADNSLGVVTVFLPDTPVDGQWCVVGGVSKLKSTNVIVDGNGNDIMIALDQSCNLNINYAMFLFYWNEDEDMWKINIWGTNGRIQ